MVFGRRILTCSHTWSHRYADRRPVVSRYLRSATMRDLGDTRTTWLAGVRKSQAVQDATNEWRMRYFDGQWWTCSQIHSPSLVRGRRKSYRQISLYSAYFTLDIVELEGDMVVFRLEDGQVCPKALHQSYEDYWRRWPVVEGAPHLPEGRASCPVVDES